MTDATIETIVDAIASDGYAIVPGAVSVEHVTALREAAWLRDSRGEFVAAGIGRGGERVARADVRGDRICWINESDAHPAETHWLERLESMRRSLNAALMLGLFEFEGHYAIYPAGSRYARHRDRFRDAGTRVLSCVLYLNAGWTDRDGGALRLYTDASAIDVLPRAGTLALFLSERFDHEVRPTRRERYAFTGWFRRRPS